MVMRKVVNRYRSRALTVHSYWHVRRRFRILAPPNTIKRSLLAYLLTLGITERTRERVIKIACLTFTQLACHS